MSRYRERVWPSVWVFLIGILVIPSVILVFLPINVGVGVMVGIAVYVGYVALLVGASPVIEVTDALLRVGSAHIPLTLTGDVRPYESRERARAAAGPDLDARAWLCLRGWVSSSARVDVVDEADPVPYWLFSTRHPDAVRVAVESARAARRAD